MLSSTTRTGQRRTRLLAAIGAVLMLAALVVPASAASATDTIGVSGRPADDAGHADGRTRFSYSSDPGQKVTDRFLVQNTGSAAQDFTIYPTDAFTAADGTFSLLPTSQEPADVGTWIRFDDGQARQQFRLEPGEERLMTFTLDVPAEATPGDHVGGIVASVLEPGTQVSIDRRVATGLFLRVSGELQPRLAIDGFDASYSGDWWNPFSGAVTMHYSVSNPGNVALAANISTGVNTWFGLPASAPAGGAIDVVLPGSTAAFDLQVPGVAQLLFLNPWVRLNPIVDDPDITKQVPIDPVSRDGVTWAVPWTLLIVLALAAVVVLVLRWRRRREDERARAWMEHTEREAREAARREEVLVGGAGRADE